MNSSGASGGSDAGKGGSLLSKAFKKLTKPKARFSVGDLVHKSSELLPYDLPWCIAECRYDTEQKCWEYKIRKIGEDVEPTNSQP